MRITALLAVLLAVALAAWAWWSRPIRVTPAAATMDTTAPVPPRAMPEPAPYPPDTGRQPAAPGPGTAPAARLQPAPGDALLVPVQGIDRGQLADTFTDARSEGRPHDAIDIMAPAGTPVLAVTEGHVEKLFDSERGGLTVYQFDPSGQFAYYYAHLQAYAPGLAEGQQLRRGDVLGTVGSTGNASDDAPHLHFAIFRLGPERRWWEGEAINPYPHLREGTVPR